MILIAKGAKVITISALIVLVIFMLFVIFSPVALANNGETKLNESAWEKFDINLNSFTMNLRNGMSVFLPGTAPRIKIEAR